MTKTHKALNDERLTQMLETLDEGLRQDVVAEFQGHFRSSIERGLVQVQNGEYASIDEAYKNDLRLLI
ncbi:hypothetical protein [Terasakiella pusilla]|uniref:hypothetical protein n=1 Tax=Terasakiella pusilla TaxID=64973 RepID=UPI003AA8AEEF